MEKKYLLFLSILYFAFTIGKTNNVEEEVQLLKELDRLSDMANDVPTLQEKKNFCKFSEPYTVEVEEVFNRNVTKSFQVPCSDLQGSLGTRNKRDMCEVFRTVTSPTKRLVTKTLYREVEGCCDGWTGDDCMTAVDEEQENFKRQTRVNPGSCPTYSSPGRFAQCEDQCQTDADCGRTNKCCTSTCVGKKCVPPILRCSCRNGGTCDANSRCVCPIGYVGDTCELRIRVKTDSCVKQNVVIKYGTVSSDTLTLNVSQARSIMEQLVEIGKKELRSKCRSKATLRLGTVQVSESSGYKIEASFEYLIHPGYTKWDFATCVASANILKDIVNAPAKAPPIQRQFSSYKATQVTKDSSGLRVSSTCCNPGSVFERGYCRMFKHF